jgi:hypothetical protein
MIGTGEQMMELNAEQIKKLLEHCANWTVETGCKGCPYDGECIEMDVMNDALSLIKELTEENERLRTKNEALVQALPTIRQVAKADTVREFAEKAKNELRSGNAIMDKSIADLIDQIAKEMQDEE